MEKMNTSALLIFHLKVGARLALKKLAPVLGMMFAVYFIFKPELYHQLFSFLLSRGSLVPGFVFTLICGVTSRMSASRICLGLTGWMRHLPLSGVSTRRLAETAIFVAQTPVLLCMP